MLMERNSSKNPKPGGGPGRGKVCRRLSRPVQYFLFLLLFFKAKPPAVVEGTKRPLSSARLVLHKALSCCSPPHAHGELEALRGVGTA